MSSKKNENIERSKKANPHVKTIYRVLFLVIVAVVSIYVVTRIAMSETKPKTTETKTETVKDVFVKEGELTFSSVEAGYISKIDIEVAEDFESRAEGLMFRQSMKEDQGMFFIFPAEDYQSFWMRNTEISLDIIFVNSKNEIVTIHKNTTTFSDQSYPSSKPAVYVVEVIAGYTIKHQIKVGDKIVWRRN